MGSDSFSRTDFCHSHEADATEQEFGWEESWPVNWHNNLPDGDDPNEELPTVTVIDNSEPLPDAPDVVAESFASYTAELPALLARLQTYAPATRVELRAY
jgi:hypothetical protein